MKQFFIISVIQVVVIVYSLIKMLHFLGGNKNFGYLVGTVVGFADVGFFLLYGALIILIYTIRTLIKNRNVRYPSIDRKPFTIAMSITILILGGIGFACFHSTLVRYLDASDYLNGHVYYKTITVKDTVSVSRYDDSEYYDSVSGESFYDQHPRLHIHGKKAESTVWST